MKKLIFSLTLSAAFALATPAFAQAKKKPAAAPEAPAAPAAPAKPEPAKADAAKPEKPYPMNSRADEIDAAGKSFTQINKDGKKVKHSITATTEVLNAEKPAKFEDIKVGDVISGLRLKKNADGTEYDVVKITKFGPKAEKAPAEKKAKK